MLAKFPRCLSDPLYHPLAESRASVYAYRLKKQIELHLFMLVNFMFPLGMGLPGPIIPPIPKLFKANSLF